MLATARCLSLLTTLATMVHGELITDGGWRPVSREKVFTSRNFIKTHVNRNSEARNAELSADSTFGADVKLTDAPEIFHPWLFYSADSHLPREDFIQSDEPENFILPSTQSPNHRTAKKLSTAKENKITDDAYTKRDTTQLTHHTTYETSGDADEIAGEQSNVIAGEYAKGEQSPTNDFFKILSNYNIRSSDRLPNYSLSLRHNNRLSPVSNYIYRNVPIKIPLRYNSPDHLPLDPLLAVLLSNYGYYIPGHYGIQGNYQNLYGYSASNNIHNNKPFGSYKLFSDSLH